MKNRRTILVGILVILIVYLWPVRAAHVIDRNLSVDRMKVKWIEIVYPGYDGDRSDYSISQKGIENLLSEFENMKLVRLPFGQFISGYTTKEIINMDLVIDDMRVVYIRTFRSQVMINDNVYFILNPDEIIFRETRDELEKKESS